MTKYLFMNFNYYSIEIRWCRTIFLLVFYWNKSINACFSLKCVRQFPFTYLSGTWNCNFCFRFTTTTTTPTTEATARRTCIGLYCNGWRLWPVILAMPPKENLLTNKLVIYIIFITIFVWAHVINWSLWPYIWPTKLTKPDECLCAVFIYYLFANCEFFKSFKKIPFSIYRLMNVWIFHIFTLFPFERHTEANNKRMSKWNHFNPFGRLSVCVCMWCLKSGSKKKKERRKKTMKNIVMKQNEMKRVHSTTNTRT